MRFKLTNCLFVVFLSFSLVACQNAISGKTDYQYPRAAIEQRRERGGKMLGEGGFVLLGGSRKDATNKGGAALGVHPSLWSAALEQVKTMPLLSADPVGGTIITDWYGAAASSNSSNNAKKTAPMQERFKFTIVIRGTEFQANALQVSAFRQVRHGLEWVDTPASGALVRQMEEAIYQKARQHYAMRQAKK
jgi:hypothetical protein